MKQNKTAPRIVVFALALLLTTPLHADETRKITVGLPILNFKRDTLSKHTTTTSPVGLAGEYTGFFSSTIGFCGQFTLNLGEGGTLFIGGGSGLVVYWMGGAKVEHSDSYLKSISQSSMHIYSIFGLTGRAYNFAEMDKNNEALAEIKDSKDKEEGIMLGPLVSIGAEIPTGYFLSFGLRLQIIQSLASESAPDIAGQEIWLYSSFLL